MANVFPDTDYLLAHITNFVQRCFKLSILTFLYLSTFLVLFYFNCLLNIMLLLFVFVNFYFISSSKWLFKGKFLRFKNNLNSIFYFLKLKLIHFLSVMSTSFILITYSSFPVTYIFYSHADFFSNILSMIFVLTGNYIITSLNNFCFQDWSYRKEYVQS